jgi:hypothetical protein
MGTIYYEPSKNGPLVPSLIILAVFFVLGGAIFLGYSTQEFDTKKTQECYQFFETHFGIERPKSTEDQNYQTQVLAKVTIFEIQTKNLQRRLSER